MRKAGLLLSLLAVMAAGIAWWFREPLAAWWREPAAEIEIAVRDAPQPDPTLYGVMAAELNRWRGELAARHRAARNDTARKEVEHDARVLLECVLPEMMRCWLGTPWDYNGTASRPGDGAIACGYYVATVLKDAGFNVNRYQLAKQPSENILRSFLPQDSCKLSVGKDYDDYAAELDKAPHGIHLVGLDTHVAFVVKEPQSGFRFIHSSGSKPWCVVDESRDEALVLRRSNWRMLGNLTADPDVIRRWLRGERIAVRGA
jgi:hypothetical protein